MIIIKIAVILFCLFCCYAIWQYFELKRFGLTQYQVRSEKVSREHRFVMIADLHGYEYGTGNKRLLAKIRECRPQMILIAGDMIISRDHESYRRALMLLEELVKLAPVCYGFGNHESRAEQKNTEEFDAYIQKAKALGVHFLRNQNQRFPMDGDTIWVGGMEIAPEYYEKKTMVSMDPEYPGSLMGQRPQDGCQILLAHNPMYSEQYTAWGADLSVCGHYHGGLVRIPGIGSVISPQMTFFPKYSGGIYEIDGKKVVVSRGLGTHTFHVRVFNRAELILVRFLPDTLEKTEGNR